MLPKPSKATPELLGVRASYAVIHSLYPSEGMFFTEEHDAASDAVCVLGEAAKINLFGYEDAIGQFVKVNGAWKSAVASDSATNIFGQPKHLI